MVEEATALRAGAGHDEFYPDAEVALGVEEAVFKTQYPQVFAGHAKNSCPLFVSKPGKIQMTGLECITTIENMHSEYRIKWFTPSFVRSFVRSFIALNTFFLYQLFFYIITKLKIYAL